MEDFKYPERVTSLDGVPAGLREAYRQQADGTYAVLPLLRSRFAEWRAGLEAKDAELAAALAERDKAEARASAAQAKARHIVASEAIGAALEAGGCKPKFIAGATAMLMKELPIKVEDIDGEPVALLEGGGSIDHAVKIWLHGEAGSAFIAPQPFAGDGFFNGLYADLRKQLH